MECYSCKGKMLKQTTPFFIERNGYQVHFNSIPAWVCSQCGEILLDESVVALTQEAVKQMDVTLEKIAQGA